jgi:hypothetical protein
VSLAQGRVGGFANAMRHGLPPRQAIRHAENEKRPPPLTGVDPLGNHLQLMGCTSSPSSSATHELHVCLFETTRSLLSSTGLDQVRPGPGQSVVGTRTRQCPPNPVSIRAKRARALRFYTTLGQERSTIRVASGEGGFHIAARLLYRDVLPYLTRTSIQQSILLVKSRQVVKPTFPLRWTT